jgi:hypothetical protein
VARATGVLAASVSLAPLHARAQDAGALPVAPPRTPRFTATVAAHEEWDTVDVVEEGGAGGRFATRLFGSLAHARSGKRGELNLAASASAWKYHDVEGRLRLTHQESLSGAHQVSRRTRFTGGGRFQADYADRDVLLQDEGTVLPRVATRTLRADAALTHVRSPRTEFTADLTHEQVEFEDDALLGRWQAGGGLGFRRRLGRGARVGLDYHGEVRATAGHRSPAHRISMAWEATRREGVGAQVSAGLLRLTRLDTGALLHEPFASAGAWWRSPVATLSLRYEHGINLSYRSVEEQRTDLVTAALARTFARLVTVSLHSSYSWRRGLSEPAQGLIGMQRHGASLGLATRGGFALGTDYLYQRRGYVERSGVAQPDRHQVTAYLSYGHRWW